MSFLNPSVTDTRRKNLIIGGLSVLVTAIVATGFLVESRWGYLPPDPKLIFFQSWEAGRTRADALATRAAEEAELKTNLEASRAYIASLPPGEKRAAAQAQYDRYLAAPNKDRVS